MIEVTHLSSGYWHVRGSRLPTSDWQRSKHADAS